MISIPREAYDDSERVAIPPGRYLVEITSARDIESDSYLNVAYTVLGPRAGAKGEERFYYTPKAVKRLGSFLKRIGLVERGTQGDEMMAFEPADLYQQRVVVDIINEEVEGKKGTYTAHRWDYQSFWRDDDPRVADFMRSLRAAPSRPAPTTDDEV